MIMDMLTKMMERLDRLESDRATPSPHRRNQQRQASPTPRREILLQRSLWFVTSVEKRATLQEGVQFAVLSRWESRYPWRKGPRV